MHCQCRPVTAFSFGYRLVKLMLYVSRVMTLGGVGRATSCVTAGAPGCLVVAERAAPVAQERCPGCVCLGLPCFL